MLKYHIKGLSKGLLWYFNGACQDGRKAQQLGYDATELIRIPCNKIL